MTRTGWKNIGSSQRPVILVHGFGGCTYQWFAVQRSLRTAGFSSVSTMSYNAVQADITILATRLADQVRSVLQETGADKVHLVGHSLGGIIIRYAVSVLGLDGQVDTAITISSPHGGSPIARLGWCPTARQLQPGSMILRKIEAAARPGSTRWVAFYSHHDVVVPAARAQIRPAALTAVNIPLHGEGHISILTSPVLVQQLTARLRAPRVPITTRVPPLPAPRPHLTRAA